MPKFRSHFTLLDLCWKDKTPGLTSQTGDLSLFEETWRKGEGTKMRKWFKLEF